MFIVTLSLSNVYFCEKTFKAIIYYSVYVMNGKTNIKKKKKTYAIKYIYCEF